MSPDLRARWPGMVIVLLLLLLPSALLGDCVFGGKKFMPFDLAEFPPVSTALTAEQVAALREGSNYDATEAPVWFAPELQLIRKGLAAHEYPHWNPYVRGGGPLTAHGHLGLFDPLHWPALAFADPADGLLYLTYAMFALAGVLMYGFLRALRLERLPAAFGAVAFALSGTLTANGHWYMRMEPIVLLPGMLWAALALSHRRGSARALPAVLLAAAVGCCWTAGFPPFCIPATLALALFCLCLCVRAVARDGWGAASKLALWLAGATCLGFGLAGAQVLQQLAFYPVSNRSPEPTLATLSHKMFDPCGLLGYLFPDLFSHPTDRSLSGDRSALVYLLSDLREWGTGRRLLPNYNFTEYAVFPGTLTLFFAVLGALTGKRMRWLCVLALAITLALALAPGPLANVFLLPGLKLVPPMRCIGIACVFVAMLAAFGVQALRQGETSPWLLRSLALLGIIGGAFCVGQSTRELPGRTTVDDPWITAIAAQYREVAAEKFHVPPELITPAMVLATRFTGPDDFDQVHASRERLHGNLRRSGFGLLLGGAFLLLVSLRGRERPLALELGVLALLFTGVELGDYGHQLNRGKDLPFPLETPVHDFLRRQRDLAREQGGFMVARANTNGDPWILPPGTLARDGIRDLNFYTFADGHSNEPIRRLYGDDFMLHDVTPSAMPDDDRLALPWWDLLGVRFLLATTPMQHAGVRVGPELKGPKGPNDEFFVYERPHPLPRAWVVPAIRTVADDSQEIDAVLAKDLDARASVVMTVGEARKLGAPLTADPTVRARTVRFVFEDEKRTTLQVTAGASGYLVVADTMLPGWTVTVNGSEAPLARGNVYQRVLPLPAAACEVEFRYVTPGLKPGLALSALAGLACVAWLWLARRRATEPNQP